MTAVAKCVVKMPHVSGLDKDTVENTFVIKDGTLGFAALAASIIAGNSLQNFYNVGAAGSVLSPSGYLSAVLSRAVNAASIEIYDIGFSLDGTSAGPPISTTPWTLGALAGGEVSLPAEVAIACTLYGEGRGAAPVLGSTEAIPTDDRAQDEGAPATHTGRRHVKQSHTGRLYIGPCNANAFSIASGEVRVSNTAMADLNIALEQLYDDIVAHEATSRWGVWSRRLAQVNNVIGGHTDNAPDTQRRRGVASSTRQVWTVD